MKRIEIYVDSRGTGRCRSCGAAIEWAEEVASSTTRPLSGCCA